MPVFVVAPYNRSSQAVVRSLQSDSKVQVVECKSALDVVPMIRKVGVGVIVNFAPDKGQVIKHIQLLKVLQPLIRRKLVSVIEMTRFNVPNILDKFHDLGCSEVLVEPTNPKAVQIKVQRYASSLGMRLRQKEAAGPRDGEDGKTGGAQRGAYGRGQGAGQGASREVKYVRPLELESDCWLVKGGGARNVMGRWLVKLMGPSPSVGKWMPMEEGQSVSSDQAFWQWVLKDPNDVTFINEQGNWVFRGQKPEFRGEVWSFVGKRPELSFIYQKKAYGTKFGIDPEDGALLVANDSKQALAKLPAIYASIEAVLRLSMKEREAETDETAFSGSKRAAAEDTSGFSDDPAGTESEGEEIGGEEIAGEASAGANADGESPAADAPAEPGEYPDYDGEYPESFVPPDEAAVRELAPGTPGLPVELRDAQGKILRIAVDQFGDGAGAWVHVCANAGGGKWYVYIARELIDGAVADVRALPCYWIYLGPETPAAMKDESGEIRYWAFLDEKPAAVRRFSDLIKPIRDFLLDRWAVRYEISGEEGGRGADDRRGQNLDDAADWKDHSEGDPAPEREWNENAESEVKPGNGAGADFSESISAGSVDPDEGGPDPDRDSELDDGESGVEHDSESGELERSSDLDDAESGVEVESEVESEVERESNPDEAEPDVDDAESEEQYLVPLAEITPVGGEWHYVATDDQGLVHVYVPKSLASGERQDLEQFGAFFVFTGSAAPVISDDGEHWFFSGGQPYAFDEFKALPESVKSYLVGLTVDRARSANEKAPLPDFKESVRERIRARKDGLAPEVVQALDQVEASLQSAATQGIGGLVNGGPESIAAERPPGPSLGPLAIGVLAAELVSRRGLEATEAASRFCRYLSASCGGLRIELWMNQNGSWACGATSDGTIGVHAADARWAQKNLSIKHKRSDFSAENTLVGAVMGYHGGLLGALVVSGDGASLVSPEYLSACAEMALGIVLSVAEEAAAATAA